LSRRHARLAVPPMIAAYPTESGVGKMWHHVLAELREDLSVRFVEPSRGRARLWRPDVWAYDGHQGPLPVEVPVVAQLHEAAWQEPETRSSLGAEFVVRYDESSRASALRATRIVTPSESSRRQIVESYGVPGERVVVAPHGVDHAVFHPGAEGGQSVIERGGGDAERPYVVFVSQLHPRKNLAALRDAMTRLADRGYPHALVLVSGARVDRAASATLENATAPNVVHLEGLSEGELAGVIAGATAFCLPSLMEGFGLTALEAMACGVPAIVSDRGALPEVVGDAGVVTAPTTDAIEAALARVLHDDREARALGEAGYQRAKEFTWGRTAGRWRAAIDEARAAG
jgi:glycosyltransferase involved in cell wall biosynthesis